MLTRVHLDTQESAASVRSVVMRGGQRPVLVVEPFTNTHLQGLLLQASNLGYNFDRNLMAADEGASPAPTNADTNVQAGTVAGDNNADSAAAGAIGHNADNPDDARMDKDTAESAIAISVKRSDNQFLLDVMLMTLGPSPTVDDVLRLMKDRTDPNTRAICQELQQIPSGEITVGTAKKPVSFRILDQYAGDAVVGFRSLGTVEEAVNGAVTLEPCIDCAEAEDLRKFRTPPISSSTPVFILYCHCQVSLHLSNPTEY